MVWLSCRSSTRAGEGNSLLGEAFLGKQIYSPSFKFVDGADDTYLLIVDKRFEDRCGGIELFNIQRDRSGSSEQERDLHGNVQSPDAAFDYLDLIQVDQHRNLYLSRDRDAA